MSFRALVTMCMCLPAFLAAERATAYGWDSEIGYDTETATLSGYSRTWKDPADWNYRARCLFLDFDIDLGWYCSRYHWQFSYASLHGEIHRESQDAPVFSKYTWDAEAARTDHATAMPAGDVWTARADHYYENFDGILLTSGYRCPHGNDAVGGVQNSYHTHGRVADLWRNGWTETEFNNLAGIADQRKPVERFEYDRYPDHHLHVAF